MVYSLISGMIIYPAAGTSSYYVGINRDEQQATGTFQVTWDSTNPVYQEYNDDNTNSFRINVTPSPSTGYGVGTCSYSTDNSTTWTTFNPSDVIYMQPGNSMYISVSFIVDNNGDNNGGGNNGSIGFRPPTSGSYDISFSNTQVPGGATETINTEFSLHFGPTSDFSYTANGDVAEFNQTTTFSLNANNPPEGYEFDSWDISVNGVQLTDSSIINSATTEIQWDPTSDNITVAVNYVESNGGGGNGLTNGGQLTSATNTTFIQGATFTLNSADVNLNGSNYYTLPSSTLGSTWTVALRYKPEARSGTSQIFTQQTDASTDIQCSIGYFSNGLNGAADGYYAGVFLSAASAGSPAWYAVGPLPINNGTTYNIALSLNAHRYLRCYLDGVHTGSTIALPVVPTSTQNFVIGSDWMLSNAVVGTLYSLKIFSRALPADAISYLASGSLSSTIQYAPNNGLLFELDATKTLVDLIDISSSTPDYNPVVGDALVLDGSSFYTIANSMDTTQLTNAWTVAMRYMELSPPAAGSYSQIIGQKAGDENDGGRVFTIGKFNGETSYTEPEYIVSMIKLPEGTWEHSTKFMLNSSGWTDIVASFNGTSISVYVDGVRVGERMPVQHKITSSQPLYIGKSGWVAEAPLINGAIAQLLIYNRSMSESEAYFLHSGTTLPLIEVADAPEVASVQNTANEMMKNPDVAIATAMEAATAVAAANNEPVNYGAVITSFLLATTKLDSATAKSIAADLMSNQTLSGRQDVIFPPYRDLFYEAIGITGTQPLVAVAPTSTGNLDTSNISTGSALAFLIKAAGTYTLDTGDTLTINANDEQYFQKLNSSDVEGPLAQGGVVTLSNGRIFRITFLDPVWGEVGFHVYPPSSGSLDVTRNSATVSVTSPNGYTSSSSGTYVVTASNIPEGTILTSWLVNDNGSSTTVTNINNTYSHVYTNTSTYIEVSAQYLSSKLTVVKPDSTDGTVSVGGDTLIANAEYLATGNYSLVATPVSGKVFRGWSIVVGSTKADKSNTGTTLSYDFTITGSNVTITPEFGTPGSLTIVYPTSGGTVSVDGTQLTQNSVITAAGTYALTASVSGFGGWTYGDPADIANNSISQDNPFGFVFDGFSTVVVTATFNGGGGSGSGAICFLKNAPVLTPSGYRRIADLRVGDLVQTPEGTTVPIQAVKVQQRVAPSQSVNPYVIPKGQFGATKELLISPEHKVLVNGAMVEARYLGLKQAAMTTPFDYYNIELPNYEQMVVAGVTVESLYPMARVTITMAQFKEVLAIKYGPVTPELLARLKNKVRFLPNGLVNIPVDKRALH